MTKPIENMTIDLKKYSDTLSHNEELLMWYILGVGDSDNVRELNIKEILKKIPEDSIVDFVQILRNSKNKVKAIPEARIDILYESATFKRE